MAGRMSKKIWLILVILIIAVGAIVGIALSCDSSSPPDGTLSIVTWNETSLSAFEGTPVVLNFWSISCPWCVKQLPYLENVAQQNEEELKVIAINMRDSASQIRTFFGDYRPTMIIALDTNREAFADYCLAYNNTRGAIPFTLFFDSEGLVQYVKIGAFASETELRDILDSVF
jgi:thiol-disulfide isomerase/thioredoxin